VLICCTVYLSVHYQNYEDIFDNLFLLFTLVVLPGAKSMTQGVGTACWLSPEVICHAHFSKHSDVYAFGIILWEVFTRSDVYVGLSVAQIISKVSVCFCFILFRLFEIVCCGH